MAEEGDPGNDPREEGQIAFALLSAKEEDEAPRVPTGIQEIDRVCGGGLVAGSVTLIAGDPGIGKSTLLLKLAAMLSRKTRVAYVSGEEGTGQIKMRAKRMGIGDAAVELVGTCNLSAVLTAIRGAWLEKKGAPKPKNPESTPSISLPGFLVIDSIQTMSSTRVDGVPGTLSQVRECAHELVKFAKESHIPVMIVGHITKEGMIAGPKVLEHMVDTVLYFEGERGHPYRILRTVKNRFGPTDEIGVFDMTERGLEEVANPSVLFLSQRKQGVPGACVFSGMEGTRPLLVEIQALTTQSFLASPRRAVVGWDGNRMSMVLAVLEARCQINFSQKDVFLSVLGGLRITEPAADLCVALALLSCLKRKPIPHDIVAFGELGLTGEARPVSHSEQRFREAGKLGFTKVFAPSSRPSSEKAPAVVVITHVRQLLSLFDVD